MDEGLRCLIFGKPSQIPEDKIQFYLAYAKNYESIKDDDQESVEGAGGADDKAIADQPEEEEDDDYFDIERIVHEYSTIKNVLINNSFPVDIITLQSGGEFNVGNRATN